jgi:hypothetical protein
MKTLILRGRSQCKVKNNVSVPSLTINPAHTHFKMSSPKKGITLKNLVITITPQKLIFDRGRAYPRNALPIVKIKITLPASQVFLWLEEFISRAFPMWRYIIAKNILAILA